MEYEEYEEKGISFIDTLKIFAKGWIPGLLSCLGIFILTIIVFLGVLNPKQQTYVVEFNYAQIPGIGTGNGYYVDGSIFNYKSIIDSENISTVMENNKENFISGKDKYDYSTIDLVKLLNKNFTIDINRVYYDKVSDDEAPELKEVTYIINAPKKAFKNSNVAKCFFEDLIELPLVKTKGMIKNLTYDSNLYVYEKSPNFADKLSCLDAQITLIKDTYSNYNSTLGGTTYIVDGEPYNISTIIAELDSFLNSNNYSSMNTEIRQLGYYNTKSSTKDYYRQSILYAIDDLEKSNEYLNKQLDTVNSTFEKVTKSLENITSSTDVVTTEQVMALLTQVSTQYTSDINSLKNQILANNESERVLRVKLNAVDNTKSEVDPVTGDISYVAKTAEEIAKFDKDNGLFENRLNTIYERLVEETKVFSKIYNSLRLKNMTIYYTNANIVSVEGGTSLVKVGIIAIAAGLVTGLVVAGIVGGVKNYKQKSKENEEITA